MIEQAIEVYHDLLNDQVAAENFGLLNDMMQQRHLAFGERLICNVLRPHFLTPHEYNYLQNASETLLGAFRRLFEAIVEQPSLRLEVGLTPLEEAVFAIDPGYCVASPTGRLDSFLSHEPVGDPTLHFVEYNAETPAGAGYEDLLGEAFLELPIMQQYQQQYELTMIPLRQSILDTLLAMHKQANGHMPPTIAIVDWENLPTRNEFKIFNHYFQRQGVDSFITTPERMDYDGHTLRGEGKPIHIIYKRILCEELLERYGLKHPIIDALRDGNVTMVNPFRCKPLHKKMSFALLSDEQYAHLYTPQQRQAIRRHIPWTRQVADRATLPPSRLGGEERRGTQKIDLLPYIAEHRNELVLKPNDAYGGKGVIIGWESSAQEWEAAIKNALNEPTVVQRKVKIAYENFPAYINGQLDISQRLVDLDPYLFNGDTCHGLLTRLSGSSLLNVTAGTGSIAPTFIIERK